MSIEKQITKNCNICSGIGYTIINKGNYSQAKICSCISECVQCGGTGTVFSENDNGYKYLQYCDECGIERLKIRRYNNAKIPSKFSSILRSDNIDPQCDSQYEAMEYVKSFVDKYPNGKGFLLMGGPGVGKTSLAVGAIAELALRKAVQCLFTDFFYLLSDLKRAYSDGIPENEIIGPLIEADVLVIDEMGKGKSSEWELNILDQIISNRYNYSKTVLITTNFVAKDYLPENSRKTDILEDRVGERIASRLREMCNLFLIEGNDYRKRALSV